MSHSWYLPRRKGLNIFCSQQYTLQKCIGSHQFQPPGQLFSHWPPIRITWEASSAWGNLKRTSSLTKASVFLKSPRAFQYGAKVEKHCSKQMQESLLLNYGLVLESTYWFFCKHAWKLSNQSWKRCSVQVNLFALSRKMQVPFTAGTLETQSNEVACLSLTLTTCGLESRITYSAWSFIHSFIQPEPQGSEKASPPQAGLLGSSSCSIKVQKLC